MSGLAGILYRIAFDVTVKSDWPPLLPRQRVIAIDPWPRTHGAEKHALRWTNYDPDMPTPNNQISRLGMSHSLKIRGSDVEIGGVYVAVGKTSVSIYC